MGQVGFWSWQEFHCCLNILNRPSWDSGWDQRAVFLGSGMADPVCLEVGGLGGLLSPSSVSHPCQGALCRWCSCPEHILLEVLTPRRSPGNISGWLPTSGRGGPGRRHQTGWYLVFSDSTFVSLKPSAAEAPGPGLRRCHMLR